MAWRGSFSRSVLSGARSARIRPGSAPSSSSSIPRPPRRSPAFSPSRPLGALGCVQSLLPLHGGTTLLPRLTAHMSVSVRACCELSQGTFRRTCQDR